VVNRRNDSVHYGFCFRFLYGNSNNNQLQYYECSDYRYGQYGSGTTDHYTGRTNHFLFGWLRDFDFFNRWFLFVVDRGNNRIHQRCEFRFLYRNHYNRRLFGYERSDNCYSEPGSSGTNH
jgi:hypothetical protein